ncbi:sigma-70 family RNA polymerase sigma factor [Nocardia sp. NPDC052254]|uniref:RNA polymerase sigma factor n=1 Tax=Nocardia sp. NPDC052254 TaxID=3155681 RepID=UPI00342DC7F3
MTAQLREAGPAVLGILVRRYGDFDAAEDAVQEAMVAASTQWPRQGLPGNPRAWLLQVAQRRLIDAVRSEISRRNREESAARREPPPAEDDSVRSADHSADDTLTLLALCCHPELSPAVAVALTLRAVGGLTTAEIAHAFLVPEATMAQRISRAKKRLAALPRPFAETGEANRWEQRRGPVLHVLYVMFTEAHTSTGGDTLYRADLAAEAIRLARKIHRLLPDDAEATGLLAVMLLTDARRAARLGPRGELIPLSEQDRSHWDRDHIREGLRLATVAVNAGLGGPYRIQAAIAALHAQAARPEDTDWQRILLLYNIFEQLSDNPMVRLNRAVAVAMVHGPSAGLTAANDLADRLRGNHRLDAVRGHLYEMAGEQAAAIESYTAAAHLTTSTPERDYLMLRAAHLRAP